MALGYGKNYGFSYGISDPTTLLIPTERFAPWTEKSSSMESQVNAHTINYGLYELTATLSGAIADTQPVEGYPGSLSGARQSSFFDDFYNRFYITPDAVDFGIVVGETTTVLNVWNAHLINTALISIDDSSLAFSQVGIISTSLPRETKPLEIFTVSVTAETAGPSNIDGTGTFIFDPTQITNVPVTGNRGRLWPIMPNWSDPVRQTWEFKTEILRSRSGKEQRIARRTTPRKSMEFTAAASEENRRRLARILDKFQYVDQVVPDIPRRVTATSVVPTGLAAFTVDDVPDWLKADTVVVVVNGADLSLRYVQSVDSGSNTVLFKNVGNMEFPVGSWICFAFIGNLDDRLSTNSLTNSVSSLAFKFSSTPAREDYFDPGAADVVFNNREVFLARPNWGQTPGVDFERLTETVDYDNGTTARFNPVAFGTRITKWGFVNFNYSEAESICKTFLRARGQRGEFYMPTWANDLPPKVALVSGGTILRTNGLEVYEAYKDSTVFQAIMVLLNDGTKLFRKVSSMFTTSDMTGTDTVVQLSTAWPYAINTSDIVMVSWLPCCRFASDLLTIDWLSDDKSQMQIAIRTLEDLTPET